MPCFFGPEEFMMTIKSDMRKAALEFYLCKKEGSDEWIPIDDERIAEKLRDEIVELMISNPFERRYLFENEIWEIKDKLIK